MMHALLSASAPAAASRRPCCSLPSRPGSPARDPAVHAHPLPLLLAALGWNHRAGLHRGGRSARSSSAAVLGWDGAAATRWQSALPAWWFAYLTLLAARRARAIQPSGSLAACSAAWCWCGALIALLVVAHPLSAPTSRPSSAPSRRFIGFLRARLGPDMARSIAGPGGSRPRRMVAPVRHRRCRRSAPRSGCSSLLLTCGSPRASCAPPGACRAVAADLRRLPAGARPAVLALGPSRCLRRPACIGFAGERVARGGAG